MMNDSHLIRMNDDSHVKINDDSHTSMYDKLPEFVKSIFQKFESNHFEIYLVGGSVRDLFMGRNIKDWDFTTNAKPEQILNLYPEGFYDNSFGTVGITDENKKVYEITTYRKEKGYEDKRHPDQVLWGKTLKDDLSRRDFTINAIALCFRQPADLQGKLNVDLIDPYFGQKDLEKRVIRAVGNPNIRFNEDALRLMRAIRIATEINFTIEPKTFRAIKKNAALINQIAKERVRDEVFKILATPYPAEGFQLLFKTNILAEILPELVKGDGVKQAKHHKDDVWTHSLLSLKYCPSNDPLVRFATLIHDIGKPVVARGEGEERTFYNHEVAGGKLANTIADRLRLTKHQKERLVLLVRWHLFTVDERQTDSAIRRFIRNVGKSNLEDMIDLRVGDRLGGGAKETSWRLEKFKERLVEVQKQPFSIQDLKVNGRDVMEILKINPGPMVGKTLEHLFNEVVLKKIPNKRDDLLAKIKEIND